MLIDVEAFYTFFRALEDNEERNKQIFRYIVALLLIRKRILRLDKIEDHANGDLLHLFDHRLKMPLTLPAPEVSPEELLEAENALNEIFECRIDID